jgi:uncharacterized protein (DUF1800 family)
MTSPLLAFALALAASAPAGQLYNSNAWSRDHAAHLLRRAGFGGTPEQIDFLHQMGRRKAVDYLLNYENEEDDTRPIEVQRSAPPGRLARREMSEQERQREQMRLRRESAAQLTRVLDWWIRTMVSTPRPLQEKLVLFWHGHFTSGFREVRSSYYLFEQNQLFRKHAAGNFRQLLLDVSADPAMVLYLNTQQNRRGKPNENYARELLELFTLGSGHYTEKDIKEAARAFTGISIDPATGQTTFNRRQHDDGVKTFMGRSGRWGPADIIDIILAQPAAAEHLAARVWTFFAHESPPQNVVRALARTLRKNKYEIRPMLREMFASDVFYGEKARFTHIKSPVELVVGTLRLLEMPPNDTLAMNFAMRMMGQQLMQPPNVKGWDGGETWISTSTLFNRYNLVGVLIDGTDNARARARREALRRQMEASLGGEAMSDQLAATYQPPFDPIPIIRQFKLESPEAIVDHFIDRLLQREISAKRRQILIDALKTELPDSARPDAAAIRLLLHLIVSTPEYQLS